MKKIFYLVFCFSLIIVSLFSFNSQKVFAESGVWTKSTFSFSGYPTSVSSSADGLKLLLVTSARAVYTSTDSGTTWVYRGSVDMNASWSFSSSSADGTKLVIADAVRLYTSNDSGATWTRRMADERHNWTAVAISADGSTIAATDYVRSYIVISHDSGVTWTKSEINDPDPERSSFNFYSITSSADGKKLAAVDGRMDGYIYTSNDGGITWTKRTSAGAHYWVSIASSADGTKLAAGVAEFEDHAVDWDWKNAYIYTSTDSGVTWTRRTSSGINNWWDIASSSDGTKLAAVDINNGGQIHISTDSGNTWAPQTSVDLVGYRSISSSSDGTKLVAIGGDGSVYTYSSSLSPTTTPTTTTTTPSIITYPASSITKTSAVLNGNITSNGGSSISTSGFKYGLNTSYGKITTDGPTSTGTYSKEISGLVCGTTYHFSVYATNAKGTTSGSDQSFTTTACNDVNKTPYSLSASNITPNSLILSWSNPAYYPTCFVNYGTNYNTVYNYNGIGNAAGCSNRLISGLSPDTTYYFKVQGIYDGIYTGYSDIYSVKTLSSLSPTTTPTTTTTTPSIITYPASSITKTSAVLNGNITSNGGSSISTSGFKYGLNTSYGKITTDGPTSTGTYSKEISGLVCGTTYHFSVYATNAKGSSQEDYKSFTTKSCLVLDPEIKLTETPSVPLSRNLKITYPRTQGNDVAYLQTYLNSNSYNCGIVDGVFGTKTKDAVVKFQLDNGLKPDGVFGPISRVKAGL